MTKAQVIFDPFSEEFFNNPFDMYRRMRQDAPLYYNEDSDFYALTRHEDVAAALKDHEAFSSSRGCDLAMVQGDEPPQKSIIFMDPPDHRHMRSLLNKAFTPRMIQSQRDTVVEQIDHFLGLIDSDEFDVVQDFSGPFPVEVITRMAGVDPEYRQQVRHWIDTSLSREPGQIGYSEAGMQANIDTGIYYYGLVQKRRENPQDDMISKLIAAEIPGENGEMRRLDDIEITGFATLLGGAGAETVTKLVGTAMVLFARNPEQWQKLLDDRGKIPAAVEELLRYEGPVQYNVRYTLKEAHVPSGTIPAGKAVFLISAAANRDPDAFTDADTFDIERDRTEAQNLGLGYGIHSCLGAALARMESAIALEKLLDFMPRYEVKWDQLQRVHMQNVAGYSHVPVKVLR
ncbi:MULTISPECIES: cytochrome P450 [Mycolicibacterium]|jgi:cytochrome P450|uniref:Steroid C26-monooxygenase n=3 Tax=Mycolicibacterium fortuitum TaxID=1766 RepID=A0A0N9YDU3_MYCFO|nr:cytochrome P450 [Mycolicibacterium fortuitum]AIY47564.1 putative cytochrome P450 hydroxylase [Mycobacterium sp. VKM Ac-1817D]CRL82278.1 cytochrome P450 [Mycolicibacter nonchromogenicus]ALI28014.1 putative cytochrome P450 hydroxylase [Mycolicibacterium fortuitum]AMD55369.1 cytochrome [Mycolicibacterium fortuitum subsp. fortuitum DSM 46621 = ATCC 6841 = JCM 6387]EJZ16046.1 cytochrome P450 [Mycolicibacterium fortuitum subsp. fortuitum DSM 46621 = ATCC 6841 = JCM 6387]